MMIWISQSFQLPLPAIIFLLHSSLVVSRNLQSQWSVTPVNDFEPDQNASITLSTTSSTCSGREGSSYCNESLSNNFTLAPEVCLSGSLLGFLYLLEMPKCADSRGKSAAVLVTYSDANCTGPTLVQHSPQTGWIQFPFPAFPRGPGFSKESLIFHCHPDKFDEVSDPFQRTYTTGGYLQNSLEPQVHLAPCEHWVPRLTDGLIRLIYEGCDESDANSWKYYRLPIDTCRSTAGGKGLKITIPATCLNGSQARLARYWDDECKDLHDVTTITEEDSAWDSCRILNDATRQMGSIAFYCNGPGSVENSSERVAESAKRKAIALPETALKVQTAPLPPKPWVPFWKGLILVDVTPTDRTDGAYVNPMYQVLARDSCWTQCQSPLRILQVPRCFNGTRANAAFFTWTYCKGSPIFYDGTDQKLHDMLFCMTSSHGYNSLAFWCEGTGPSYGYPSVG